MSDLRGLEKYSEKEMLVGILALREVLECGVESESNRKGQIIFDDKGYAFELMRGLFNPANKSELKSLKETYLGEDGRDLGRFVQLFPQGEVYTYWGFDSAGRMTFDAPGYLVDRLIAAKIMETQSAYEVVEYDGFVCEVYVGNGSIHDFKERIENGTLLACNGVCAYDTYRDLIESQKELVLEDFRDVGIYDDEENWSFYLTEKELVRIGLGEEIAKEVELQKPALAAEMVASVDERLAQAVKQGEEADVWQMREFLKKHDPHFATDEYLNVLSLPQLRDYYRECREAVMESQRDMGDDWANRREKTASENLGFHG